MVSPGLKALLLEAGVEVQSIAKIVAKFIKDRFAAESGGGIHGARRFGASESRRGAPTPLSVGGGLLLFLFCGCNCCG